MLSSRVDSIWTAGLFLVTASLTTSTQGGTLLTVAGSTQVWALPWPQLASLLGVALVAYAVLPDRRRRSTHVSGLLDAARAEGRLESAHTTSHVEEK
ncbi:hypothetical protein SAMN05216410_2920 [Sanguibacter gelidistatuariae]|uniref:Uncharacterized protein n=1 Tax=Sanguibacter gelidistatuariae TaxID=1814289 RepID=A0A1G6SCK1_9MICO|nr:hypothetical protein [Sanguibacter gelidistatuariae]SDD13936.1 hypothetical protein SAMN05216410_2920 [Sanguibacter gelidistatuariae]